MSASLFPRGVLNGSTFGVGLVDASRSAYAPGLDGDIAAIAVLPGGADSLWTDARFVKIAEVPEPGSAAIWMLGLLLMGGGRVRARLRTQG